MKFFLDTEFIEDGKTIDLISIGIVAEDGRKYYAISNEFDAFKADQWVRDNVITKLDPTLPRKSRALIAQEVLDFVGEKPQFWGYYADYDWVVLCQLYGRMIDLPKGWPMFCMDVKQYAQYLGNPALPQKPDNLHCALDDALWTREAYWYLWSIDNSAPAK